MIDWAMPGDFQEAIQNPRLCFSDPELQQATAVTNVLGLPRPITGNFASVYQMEVGGKSYAVRCFLRPQPDREARYAEIGAALRQSGLPAMVDFELIQQGIRVRGQWYPVLKMEWIPGDSLIPYIEDNLNNPQRLRDLAERFQKLTLDLQRLNLAHGDLQHGNILVQKNGNLRLIDYDGMYVPALRGQPGEEVGHRNYQHPDRSAYDFGPHIDNFSAHVIYLSLIALSIQPKLWTQLDAGDECLLLRQVDFENMSSSKRLQALSRIKDSQFQSLFMAFQEYIQRPPAQIPGLDGVLPGNVPVVQKPRGPGAVWLEDYVQFGDTDADSVEQNTTPEPPPPPQRRPENKTPLPPTRKPSGGQGASWIYDYFTPDNQPKNRTPLRSRGARAASSSAQVPPPPPPRPQWSAAANDTPTRQRITQRAALPPVATSATKPEIEVTSADGQRLLINSGFTIIGLIIITLFGVLPVLVTGVIIGGGSTALFIFFMNRYSQLPDVQDKALIRQRIRKIRRALREQRTLMEKDSKLLAIMQQREKSDVIRIENMSEGKYLREQLRQYPIKNASIPGIGRSITARLNASGVHTAADIEYAALQQIQGMGEYRIGILEDWKADLIDDIRSRTGQFRRYQTREVAKIHQIYQKEIMPIKTRIQQNEQTLNQHRQMLKQQKILLASYRDINPMMYMLRVMSPDI